MASGGGVTACCGGSRAISDGTCTADTSGADVGVIDAGLGGENGRDGVPDRLGDTSPAICALYNASSSSFEFASHESTNSTISRPSITLATDIQSTMSG